MVTKNMDSEQINISAVACIGVGLIGQGWATVFALKCKTVVLQDISEDRLALAIEKISKNLDFLDLFRKMSKCLPLFLSKGYNSLPAR
jgi:3-hydroxyacyl-CoA dehydrogenase